MLIFINKRSCFRKKNVLVYFVQSRESVFILATFCIVVISFIFLPNKNERRKMDMETKQKECEICGVWFTPSRSSQKYCPECGKDSTKAWRDLHKHMQYSVARVGTGRPVSKTEVECKYCHKTFTCYNGVTSAYCSKACEAADRIQNTFCACCGKPMLETDDQQRL